MHWSQLVPITRRLSVVYDVAADDWLGRNNGFRRLAAGPELSSAIVQLNDGSLSTYCGAAQMLERARTLGKVAALSSDSSALKLFDVASEYWLQALVAGQNDAYFNSLPPEGRFVAIRPLGQVGMPDVLRRAIQLDDNTEGSAALFYSHFGTSTRSIRGWSGTKPRSMLLMSDEAWAQWESQLTVQAANGCLSRREYTDAFGYVNAEVLRVAHIIGPHAIASAFDVRRQRCSVQVGSIAVAFSQSSRGLYSLQLLSDDRVVFSADGLPAVMMRYGNEGGGISRECLTSSLASAAFHLWKNRDHAARVGRADLAP